MYEELPLWGTKMDALFHAKTPFLSIVSFDRNLGHTYTLNECVRNNILFDFHGSKNFQELDHPFAEVMDISFEPLDFDSYKKQFNQVMAEIKHGNTYLLNLCSESQGKGKLALRTLFNKSVAPYRMFYKDQFVVFSPECFVRWKGEELTTYPMKGTIDATIDNAREILKSDEKEIAEHYTIVDLLRNDVGSVCDQVEVSRFAYVEKLHTSKGPILQMSSEIRGKVSKEYMQSPARLFYSLLPAGSISGAPKIKTLEIIRSVELAKRGYYTGVMVYFDGIKFDSAVMIRFIEKDETGKFWYKSGGGITHKSDARKEYDELVRKIYLPFI